MTKLVSLLLASILIAAANSLVQADDQLGSERLDGLSAGRVIVDLQLDSQSQLLFLRSRTQLRERIASTLNDAGVALTNSTSDPRIICLVKIRAVPVTPPNQPPFWLFGYRVETAVAGQMNRVATPSTPIDVEIWRKADFGVVVPESLTPFIELQIDNQIEQLSDDWSG